MVYQSPHPTLDIPKCNILSYLFPADKKPSTKPLWMDAANVSNSLSAAQMLAWIKRFAVGLDKLDLQKGSAVMVFTPNHIFVPVIYLGAAGAGRCFTGANPSYTADEVAFQMKTVDAAAVFVHPSLIETGIKAAKQAGIPSERVYLFDDTEQKEQHGIKDWRHVLASEAESESWQWDPLEGELALSTVAAINFSSGTTGLPKGVSITHRNMITNVMQVIFNKFANTDETPENFGPERWLGFLPLYHAYSQLWTINIACKLGVPIYVMRSFVYEDFLKYVQKFKITTIQAVPPVLVMLCKRPETKNYDISSVKLILCGAAPLSGDLQNEVTKRFNLIVSQGWGMSETTCAGIMFPGKLNDDSGSIGYLLPNTEARLVDEQGNEVWGEGEPGELWLRGPQILLEYWRNDEATKESKTTDGWFKTGDVAMTKNKKWWIVDRKKELIKVNGLQVAPAELEAVLLEHNDIADAAVTGIMLHGEEWPIAYIVLQEGCKTTEKDIQAFVEGKVAKHKRLVGGVKFVPEVPKLPSGKIVRKLMKEWAKRDAKEMEGKVRSRL